MSEYELFVDLIPEDIKEKIPEERQHHACWNLADIIKKENPELFNAGVKADASAEDRRKLKELISAKWQEVMNWHVKQGLIKDVNHPEAIKREPAQLDTAANKRILALVKKDYMKRIPFFVRSHATQKTCEMIAREFPDLYDQFKTEPSDNAKNEMSKLINGVFEEKMSKHNM